MAQFTIYNLQLKLKISRTLMHTGHNLYLHLSHYVYYIYERINYAKMLQIKFPIECEK